MYDCCNRRINYLRVSVTDRCNLRCVYCMPEEGFGLQNRDAILSFEAIYEFVCVAVEMGIEKVRLTGGEPLLRRDIVPLVHMLAQIDGLRDLAMTTNGVFLDEFAGPLATAGLDRVNVSLDATAPDRFSAITGGGDVHQVLRGIDAALNAGLTPLKLNCVIDTSPEEPDASDVTRFARRMGVEVRYIRRMNLSKGVFHAVLGGDGGVCERCNRLRLTSDGWLRPCLFSDVGVNVRQVEARTAILTALSCKPVSGQTSESLFHALGG